MIVSRVSNDDYVGMLRLGEMFATAHEHDNTNYGAYDYEYYLINTAGRYNDRCTMWFTGIGNYHIKN